MVLTKILGVEYVDWVENGELFDKKDYDKKNGKGTK